MQNFLISNYHFYLSSRNNGYNPFAEISDSSSSKFKYPKSEDNNQDKDIRCPICLRLVWNPVRPKSCRHVFCKDCLEIWMQTKLTCPICRASFDTFCKIDFHEFEYGFQGELFV